MRAVPNWTQPKEPLKQTRAKSKIFLTFIKRTSVRFVDDNRFDLDYNYLIMRVARHFSHSTFKIRVEKCHAAKPRAFSLHFLFRREQNHYPNLTSKIM